MLRNAHVEHVFKPARQDKEYTEDAWGSSVTDLNNTSVSIGTHDKRNGKVNEIPEVLKPESVESN